MSVSPLENILFNMHIGHREKRSVTLRKSLIVCLGWQQTTGAGRFRAISSVSLMEAPYVPSRTSAALFSNDLVPEGKHKRGEGRPVFTL